MFGPVKIWLVLFLVPFLRHTQRNSISLSPIYYIKTMKDFKYYSDCFSSLHTAKKLGKPTPHKALLLLTIIDLIEKHIINEKHIELSDILIKTFNATAKKYYAYSPIFKPEITQPFFHMQHEPFWRLTATSEFAENSLAAESEEDYSKKKPTYSIKGLRKQYRHAEIDSELFELLQNSDVRARLRVLLISTYLNNHIDILIPIATLPVYISILSTLAC